MASQSGASGSGGVAASAFSAQAGIAQWAGSLRDEQSGSRLIDSDDSSDDIIIGRVAERTQQSPGAGVGGVRCCGRSGPLSASVRDPASTSRGHGNPTVLNSREFEGPLISVAIIGRARWRWSEITLVAVASSPQLTHALRQKVPEGVAAQPHLFGFAILRSWRPLRSPGCTTRACLRAVLASEHTRCGACFFLEHQVVRTCALAVPVLVSECALTVPASTLQATQLASCCGEATAFVAGEGAGQVRDILARWRFSFDISGSMQIWPATPVFAAGLAQGLIDLDVTIVLAKNRKAIWMAPVQPSRRFRQAALAAGQSAAVHVAEASRVSGTKRARVHVAVSGPKPFTPLELIASVRQAQDLRSQSRSRETARLVLANPLSGVAALGLDSAEVGRGQVGGTVLRQSRKRMDIAAMLRHREVYAATGPFFRYVACDASPQVNQFLEIFVTVERRVRREAVQIGQLRLGRESGQEMVSRTLPLVTLGSGRSGLDDKVASHVHQVFLEYGPSVGHVLAACNDVRQVLSDMGTEFGIANFGPAVSHVLGERFQWTGDAVAWKLDEGPVADRSPFLYPFALQTPGLLHIVDWIIRSTVQQLPWWPQWQLQCKRLLQFCHGQAHRDRLRTLFEQLAGQGQSSCFDVATNRFAEWRWNTLSRAVRT